MNNRPAQYRVESFQMSFGYGVYIHGELVYSCNDREEADQVCECLESAYERGYERGKAEAVQ